MAFTTGTLSPLRRASTLEAQVPRAGARRAEQHVAEVVVDLHAAAVQPGPGEHLRDARGRRAHERRVHHHERGDLFARGAELLGHLVRDGAAGRGAADPVRAARLDRADLRQVARGHLLDRIVRGLVAAEPAGLQAVEGLVVAEPEGEQAVVEHVAADRVDAEEWGLVARRLDGHEAGPARLPALAAEQRGEVADRGRVEERGDRERNPQGLLHPVEERQREERVAAEVPEAVAEADPADPQHLLPDHAELQRQLLVHGRLALGDGGPSLRLRQGLAVDLAVVRERHPIEHREAPGHHVLRQRRPEVGAQLGARSGAAPASLAVTYATSRWSPGASSYAVTTASPHRRVPRRASPRSRRARCGGRAA